MDWHELEKQTVVKLRELAHDHGITGVHGKNKAQLIEELAASLGIEKPHEEMAEEVVHTKSELKQQIRALKAERGKLIEAHDGPGLKKVRRSLHGIRRKIRRMHQEAQRKALHESGKAQAGKTE